MSLTIVAASETIREADTDVVRFEEVSHLNNDPAFDTRRCQIQVFIIAEDGSAIRCHTADTYSDRIQCLIDRLIELRFSISLDTI